MSAGVRPNALAMSASHPAKVGRQSPAIAARYLQFPICVGGVGRRPRLCLRWPINGPAKHTGVGLGGGGGRHDRTARRTPAHLSQPLRRRSHALHRKRIGHDQVANVCRILSGARLWVPNSDQGSSRSYELRDGSAMDPSYV